MQITIQSLNLKLSQQTKKNITDLFSKKLAPLLENKGSCDLTFSSERSVFHGKGHINTPGDIIYAEASDPNFYHASLLLLEKLKRQIEKKKPFQ